MFSKIKEFFLGKPKAVEPAPEAPYKIEAQPVPAPVAEVDKPVEKKKAPAKAKKPATEKPAAPKKPRAKKQS